MGFSNCGIGVLMVLSVVSFGALGAEQALPTAEAVLDKFIVATGGGARYEKLKSQVSRGTVQMQGMSGSITILRAEPNLVYTVVELPIGKIEEGFDGSVAWAKSPMSQPRIKQGSERAAAERQAVFNADHKWREQFTRVSLVAVENVAGRDCYRIEATTTDGRKQTRYYDVQNGRLAMLSAVIKSPAGEMATETFFEDYREEAGILSAHTWIQKVMGQQIKTSLSTVEYNGDVPVKAFALPSDIKVLLDKQ